MKRSLSSAIFLCLLLIASACENSSSVPTADGGDRDHIRDSSFAVFSLDRDSLYFQESGSIRGRGFGSDPDSLKLFVGSLGFGILSITDTSLEFSVPENALSGRIRLYRGDRLAEGDVRILIIPRSPDSVTSISAFGPREGYENEQVTVLGNNLHYRRSDARLLFGDIEAPIDSFSKFAIFARVPVGVKNGPIDLIAGGRGYYLGDFRRLERPAPSIFEGNISSVLFGIHMPLMLNLRMSQDSLNVSAPSLTNTDYVFEDPDPAPFQSIGDSLVYTRQKIDRMDTTTLSFRVKLNKNEPSVSGILHYSTGSRSDKQEYLHSDIVFELDNLLYRDKGNFIEMLATQVRSRDQLRLLRYEQINISENNVIQYKLETPFDLASVIASDLLPSLSIDIVKR